MLLPTRTLLLFLVVLATNLSAQSNIAYCDNYSTLQQCIDAATGTGAHAGTAVMTPGLERDLTSTVILYSNTTLRCEQGSLIKRASGALIGSGNLSPAMLQNQHAGGGPTDSNIVIDGCTIDGNRGAGDNAKTAGIELYAQLGSKITNVVIKNSTIQNTPSQGIYGFNWQNVEIASNTFVNDAGVTNVNDGAINLVSTNGASTNVSVHHNRCDSTASATGCFKFAASNTQPITQINVSNNNITVGANGTTSLGIELFGGSISTAIQQFVVADNIINGASATDPATWGISIGGASYGTVTGNTIANTNAFGIEVIGSFTTVSHNILNNTGPISWDANVTPQTNAVFSDNVSVSPACRGIFFIASGTNYLDTGTVTSNIIRAPLRPCADGSAPAAIRIQASSNNIFNVRLVENTTQEVQSGSSAIETTGGGQVQIENNRFVNNHGTGLNLSFVAQGVNFTIKNNYYNGEGTFLVPHSTTITQQSSNIVNGVIQ